MARQPRLVVPGELHLVQQRSLRDVVVFSDDADRAAYLAALREACAGEAVAMHAYALLDNGVDLLLRPPSAEALSRAMQAVGRRYVSAYNRRHGRSGTLWDGRFRCAVIEPGAHALRALLLVDGAAARTSAPHRTGIARDLLISDPPEFWALGNTPFERESAYRSLLAQGLPSADEAVLRSALRGGWAVGSPGFLVALTSRGSRPVAPRPRGRPRKS